MKHLFFFLSFFFLLLFSQQVNADVLLDEQFTGTVLPIGWTSSGNYAVFDDDALGASVSPNESDIISPTINCSGRTAIYLAYSHYWFGVEFTHGYVEISNNGGLSWSTLVDYEKITKGALAASQDTVLNISAQAANQANVMIRFRYTDGSQAGRYWYIDDVKVYCEPDVGVTALIDPPYINCSPASYTTTETVTIEITNFGINAVSNIPVTCVVSNGISATLTGTLAGPPGRGCYCYLHFCFNNIYRPTNRSSM